MADKARIQFVMQRSKPITKIVACAVIVVCVLALGALHIYLSRLNEQIDELTARAALLTQENEALQKKIDSLDTVQGIEQVAEDELGMVDPDAIVIETD